PYLRSRTADIDETRHVETFRDGVWIEQSFISAIEELYPDFNYIYRGAGWLGARIVFDRLDRMYTAVKIRRTNGAYANVLLFSTDYGQTFSAVDLRTSGDVALEHVAGHNRLDGPPFVLIQHRRVADH